MWRRKVLFYSFTSAGCSYLFLHSSKNSIKEVYKTQDLTVRKDISYIQLPEHVEFSAFDDYHSNLFSCQRPKSPFFWRLIDMSNSKDRIVRHKAIKFITSISSFEEWEYVVFSQACGPQTAVALARSHKSKQTFFLTSPFINLEKLNWKQDLYEILKLLPTEDMDPCINVSMNYVKNLITQLSSNDEQINSDAWDYFNIYHSEWKRKLTYSLEKLLLELVLEYSCFQSHRHVMLKNGALQILYNALACHRSNTEYDCLIAQILSHFAVENDIANHFHSTGWLKELALWFKSSDIKVNLPAATALASLDTDDFHHALYDSNIYLLHPHSRQSEEGPVADIIFIHGLMGGTFYTWRQNDSVKKFFSNGGNACADNSSSNVAAQINGYSHLWPKDWLAEDFPNHRIISVDYNTSITNWSTYCPQTKEKSSLQYKANQILTKLMFSNVGTRPIIWITHSMGGLLVKQLLLEASESTESSINKVVKNTKGIVFLSVPHKGSEIANVLQSVSYIFQPSIDIQQLTKESPSLLSLHEKFKHLVNQNNIAVLSFGETKKSKWGFNSKLLVSENSANPDVGEFHLLPMNHLNTCKPESPNSELYLKIKNFLQILSLRNNLLQKKCKLDSEIANVLCLIP